MVGARGTFSALAVAVRNENVRRVELAWGAWMATEWGHLVGLGVFAYRAGGASAVGIAGLVRLLPAAIIAPVGVSFADRFPRHRFLVVVSALGAAALAASAAAASGGQRVPVYVFAAVVGLSMTLVRPTLQALLPSLARTPEELIAANSAISTIGSIGMLGGPLVAGVLVSVGSPAVVFAAAAGAVVVGCVPLVRVRVEGELPRAESAGAGAFRPFVEGLAVVAQVPGARLVTGLMAAQTFVRGCLNVLIVVAAFRVLHTGGGAVGYMTAAIGAGGLLGAIAAMALGARRLAVSFAVSLVFWGLPIALIALGSYLVAALLLLAVVGAANSIENVAGFTLLQRTTPEEALARVLAVVWGMAMGGVALGSIAAPGLVRALGPRPALLVVGAILPAVTLATYNRLRALDRGRVAGAELELIERVPMFAPLSIAAKERIAAKLIPLDIESGERVIRAGDVGDRFYIVAAGEFDVDVDGRHAAAHETDYFGEIGLLRDIPRTATVTAVVDSKLYALQRDDFLAAVTGHSAATAAGEAVVEARLGQVPTAL